MIALSSLVSTPLEARPKTIEIVVDEIAEPENCGISKSHVEELMIAFLEEEQISVSYREADLKAFADVNVIAIPNSLGTWSNTCSFDIDIEIQLHHEARMRGVGRFDVISKLCEADFTGFISDGNRSFFTQSFRQSFARCFEQLPPVVARALEP
ncbi:MAG: hypothetical protein ABJN35_00195 [Erythrobacter sp.]